MGPCVSNKTNEEFESEIFTDIEWSHRSHRQEDVPDFLKADIIPSSIIRSTRTFDQGNKRNSSQAEKLETTGGTYLQPNACFRASTNSPSISLSNNTLEVIKFGANSSNSSLSSYWRDSMDVMSYDGINKRISDRNDIGLRMLKAQIQCGADPKVWTTHGDRSCLMFAVLAEDFNFIKELIELGVDVNKTNHYGETALTLAVGIKREDIASYLRSNGAVEGKHGNGE